MKWKCTNTLLSVPVAAFAIGFGMNSMTFADELIKSSPDSKLSAGASTTPSGKATTLSVESTSGLTDTIGQPRLRPSGGITLDDPDPNCPIEMTNNNAPKLFDSMVACGLTADPASTTEQGWAQQFVVPTDVPEFELCSVQFGVFQQIEGIGEEEEVGEWPVEVRVFLGNINQPVEDAVLVASRVVNTPRVDPADEMPETMLADFPVGSVCLQPGDEIIVEIWTDSRVFADDGDGGRFRPGGNEEDPPPGDSYLRTLGSCGDGFVDFWQQFGTFGFGDLNLALKIFGADECSAEKGACCSELVACEPLTEESCLAADPDATWLPGVECEFCPQPVVCEPDECPACEGDLDDNGVVNTEDLFILLGCWGEVTEGCECADFDNNGVINTEDLFVLLGNWGPCPVADGGGTTFDEGEACGERINDGCALDDPAFGTISCGDEVCGTAWTAVEDDVNTRDLDWYSFTLDSKQTVTWQVHAEFPAVAQIVKVVGNCAETFVFATAEQPNPGIPFDLSACLQPGTYAVLVAPLEFEGLPCEGEAEWGNEYSATLKCTVDEEICGDDQKGACCFPKDEDEIGLCFENMAEHECFKAGGVYGGDGSLCEETCLTGACCFSDGSCEELTPELCQMSGGAYRGNESLCSDTQELEINGQLQTIGICRDCGDGGVLWSNPADVCDPADDPINGGCNFPENPAFEQLCCGDSVEGTVFAEGGSRDLDWRVLEITQPTVLNLSMLHGFSDEPPLPDEDPLTGIILLATDSGQCNTSIIQSEFGEDSVELSRLVDPGTYYVIVSVAAGDGDFPPTDSLPCSSDNNWYQLDVICVDQDPTVCGPSGANCFNDVTHPGFPNNTCSCDVFFCGPDTTPCCPGICDECGPGGVCDVLCSYVYDNETGTGGIGLNDPDTAIMWLHRFDAGSGDDVSQIRTSYFATDGLQAGDPVGFAVYAAAPDGSPQMPALFSGTSTIESGAIGAEFIASRQLFDFSPVSVSGEFFVAVWAEGAFPAPTDDTGFSPGIADNIWVAGEAAGFGAVDPDDLFGMSLPPLILVDANPDLQTVWRLCANSDEE